MSSSPLYPLRFEPIFQPRIWGGRRLADLFGRPLPDSEPIGEAWVLSDRADFPSRVADGPLKGQTLRQVLASDAKRILGRHADRYPRFPLLLKFLDARETLSVQVHPSDRHTELLPQGERGKTEAWVVLEVEPHSRIYAGLKRGTTREQLRAALAAGKIADYLSSFTPKPGDGVFLEAGTVHALGGGVVLFEVQQNSDVTFRLYDWDRVDAKTGKARQLHIDQALACIDFSRGAVGPVVAKLEGSEPPRREHLFTCPFFKVDRLWSKKPFSLRETAGCRILVALSGNAELDYFGGSTQIVAGNIILVPAEVGMELCRPRTPLTMLEIALPE